MGTQKKRLNENQTMLKLMEKKNNYNFTLKDFPYLDIYALTKGYEQPVVIFRQDIERFSHFSTKISLKLA